MSILNVEHLTHGFGDRAIFDDVSFRLLKGEHIGLVGANGEGKSNILVLDEPTNHLDADAKEELHRALKEYKGTVIMVCHEPDFYADLATDIIDCTKWTTKV